MFIVKNNNNMKIVLLSRRQFKDIRRIGCYYYSIDFKHGELL